MRCRRCGTNAAATGIARTRSHRRSPAPTAWVHAYLHRREGDQSNAAYWYRHAGKPVTHGNLDEEWHAIVQALLIAG